MSEQKQKVEVNVVQVVASALAAVSSAVLLSTVGVAGTVIGAAVGSVIATVGSAVYSYSLRVSRQRMAAAAQVAAMTRVTRGRRGGHEAPTEELPVAEEKAPRWQWREALGALNWKIVAMLAAGVFVVAMVVILGFELIAGHPVSSYTGGTSKTDSSRTSLFGTSSSKPTSTPTGSPSSPTASTTSPTPTETTSPSASTTTSPSEGVTTTPPPTPSESTTPSQTPSPSETPSESASSVPSP